MKTYLLALAAITTIGLTSCNKCSDCACAGTNTFTFEESMPEEDQDFITQSYTQNYQETSEELCSKRGDHEEAVAAYEAQSVEYNESSTYNGNEWTLEAKYDCTCE